MTSCFIKSLCHIKNRTICESKLVTVCLFSFSMFLLFNTVLSSVFLWAIQVNTSSKIERTRSGGKRRDLGPDGRRGTIEVLCRGGVSGGQIAALEIPTVVGYKKLNLIYSWNQRLCLSCVRWKFSQGWYVAGVKRVAERGLKVRGGECEQYARVFTGAQCARVWPGWLIQATGPAPFLLLQGSLCCFSTQMSATISWTCFW